jgi:hypothetical protein
VQNLNLRHIYFLCFLLFGAVFYGLASEFEKIKIGIKQVWRTWVKVEKVHISVTFLLITFLYIFKTFSTNWKSARNSAFFDNQIKFLKKKINLAFINIFLNFECNAHGGTACMLQIPSQNKSFCTHPSPSANLGKTPIQASPLAFGFTFGCT